MKFILSIGLILIFSCNNVIENKSLEVKKTIDLGEVRASDTIRFNIEIKNPNSKDTIKVKKISSDCNCTIIEDSSFLLKPMSTIIVNGIFIPKKEDSGLILKKIAINSTAYNPFNFVEIKAFVKR